MPAFGAEPAGDGRIVFDLSSLARWSGPPVGIVRCQRALARWLRRERPDAVFAIFDPALMAYRRVAPAFLEAFIEGEATLNAWAMPDPTGARRRRSAAAPAALYAVLQARRTLLRLLERVRLDPLRPRAARLAERAQAPLISPRYRTHMVNSDGSRRPFPTPDLAFAEPVTFTAADTLFCAAFGWSHGSIAAIGAAKAAAGFRLAVLCYDLIPLLLPRYFRARDVEAMGRYWRQAFALADTVVVNAEAIAADVRRYCEAEGLACAPIQVRPLGADIGAADADADADAPLPGGLPAGRYALFVSTLEPRKGHEMLYRLWLQLLEAGVPQAHDFKLVFVGRPGWMTEDLDVALATDARIAGSLLVLSQVSDAELDRLYRQAAFCLYPSVYEGYGLPVVEAFARGKAVLVSSGGALAEVAAGFSPALDPHDADAWRETLGRWIEDPMARAPYEAAIAARFRHPGWDEAAAGIFAAIAAPAPAGKNAARPEDSSATSR